MPDVDSPAWFLTRQARSGEESARLSQTLTFTGPLATGNTHSLRRGHQAIINFSTNDYLALGEIDDIRRAGADAVMKYGASTGASRLLAGEYELHLELEQTLANFLRAEAALTFVSGHATNVTVIGALFGKEDVIFHDQFAHNSMLEGIKLSGARRVAFRHNDLADLERRLATLPGPAGRVVVCVDGVYSMHGDLAPLNGILELKRRHGFILYLDDAHAVGTIGTRGAGSADHAGSDPTEIDIVMGTLGKALGSCGGFIAGTQHLIQRLRWTAPGFIFSAGVPAPQTAVALASIRALDANPHWVTDLRERSILFRHELGDVLDDSQRTLPTPIVPVHVAACRVLAAASTLNETGVRVFPVLPPAVPASSARLRFSVNRLHTPEQLQTTAALVRDVLS